MDRINHAVTAALVCIGVSAPAAADPDLDFALNVSRHVLLHELAHGLIREFNLPVLGNEEDMADTFATVWVTQHMRDDAVSILKDRARSWLHEGSKVRPEDYDLEGEHDLDTRRAYRTICLLYGADPAEWPEVVDWIGLSEGDANDCSDIAPQVIDGWERVLAPHRMAHSTQSQNVNVQHGEAVHTREVVASGLLNEIAWVMRQFDWPEPVTLHYDSCGREGASWSRIDSKILFCDEYFGRFLRQSSIVPQG